MSERSYRIQPSEPAADEVRRVARGRIDHAIDELRGQSESSRAESVHEARKDMKKLRALLRLVRGELGEDVYSQENACFRDTGRRLSGVRDADVMILTLADLERRFGELPGAARKLRPALVAHRFRVSAGSTKPAVQTAIDTLRQARERVDEWPLESEGFELFEEGLGRVYRRGRKGLRRAQELPTAEHVHDWRKRVKDLWYHVSLLEEAWKPVMSALADEAHALSERLGDEHDVAVLVEWAHRHASALNGADPMLRGFDVIGASRRRELQREAFDYGSRLYADKPSAFVGRIGGWWEATVASAPPAQRAST
jgi:CHAD domain-containing protein